MSGVVKNEYGNKYEIWVLNMKPCQWGFGWQNIALKLSKLSLDHIFIPDA